MFIIMSIVFKDSNFWNWFYDYRSSEVEGDSRRHEPGLGTNTSVPCLLRGCEVAGVALDRGAKMCFSRSS